MVAKLLARQLSRPSGLVGRLILAPLWNRRNVRLNEVALAQLALSPQDRVLEVGFGGGYLLGRMIPAVPAGRVAGLDLSPAMVAHGTRHYRPHIQAGRVALTCARAEAIPYPDRCFTRAVTVNSIFYWDNATQAIAELARVLAVRGMLVICFTAREDLARRAFSRHDLTLYEPADVELMMRRAGLGEIGVIRAADKHRQFWCLVGRK